jgi:hypothetical protein
LIVFAPEAGSPSYRQTCDVYSPARFVSPRIVWLVPAVPSPRCAQSPKTARISDPFPVEVIPTVGVPELLFAVAVAPPGVPSCPVMTKHMTIMPGLAFGVVVLRVNRAVYAWETETSAHAHADGACWVSVKTR